MKYLILLISIVSLTSCMSEDTVIKEKISSLEAEITSLKSENANLKNENALLRAGGDPMAIMGGGETGGLESLFPPGSTFEESSNTACFDRVQKEFMENGNTECLRLGYSQEAINTGSCTLPKSFIDSIVAKREEALLRCDPI